MIDRHDAIAPALVPEPPWRVFERSWRWMLEEEPSVLATLLPDDARASFDDYYRDAPSLRDQAEVRRRIRGAWRGEAGWAFRWLAERRGRQGALAALRVLDAGCGFGSYALLFAELGVEVTGVDLRPDRLRFAEQRAGLRQQRLRHPLALRFERADVTRPWDRTVDLVWVYNALSHMEPLDGFLDATRDALAPGGVLVIGDINGALPSHQARLARLRHEVRSEYVAPDGARHAYAIERLFPPEELRDLLEQHGMRVVHHEMYWGGLGVLPEFVFAGIMHPLQRAWSLGATIARRQLLVATRA